MMPARVSVILPVYNTESHLERCLDTLVNQTLEDIEILVVNDGSPDDSQSIIDRYAERYPDKIVPLMKENGGLSDARNFGIAHATGEYLGFVDSDDWVDLDMYERLYDRASTTDSDVVFHPMTYAFPERRVRRHFTNALDLFGKSVAESPRLLVYANSFAVNKIYRRSFWLRNGFEFPVGQAFEDSAVVYNILYAANKVEFVNIPFYYYERSRDESITNVTDERVYDIFTSCDSMLDFYREKPEYDAMKDSIEFLCISHIFVRFNLLARSDDRTFVREFLGAAYSYLERRIPDWQDNSYFDRKRTPKLRAAMKRQLRRRPGLAMPYYTAPRISRKAWRRILTANKRLRSTISLHVNSKKHAADYDSGQQSQRKLIQDNGYQLIVAVQEILGREGIDAFADFGTMLGLVREGRLLAHDLDVDMGVIINDPLDIVKIRMVMERFGFRASREYYRGTDLVESSFRLFGVKLDINYYQVDEESARTWLFYRHPDKQYGPRERDIVEMRYSPIREFTTVDVNGTPIKIPANAEQLLAEKYGPNWRVPDKDWIYWRSPAATPIDDEGSFLTYGYPGGFARAGDPRDEELYERLYRRELVKIAHANKAESRMQKLQSLELAILKEVDRVCRENDLRYYLVRGTLLGAVRSGGFIPWDDELDIAMPRADYERFLKIAPGLIDSSLAVLHWTLTPNYWSTSAEVRLRDNSVFHQPSIAHLTDENGPFIHVFPLDSVPEAESETQNAQKRLLSRYRQTLKDVRGVTKPKTSKARIARMRGYLDSIPSLYKKIEETYRKLEAPGNRFVVNFASRYPASRETFPSEFYGTPRFATFEDGEFPIPAEAEAILERLYGPDYLTLPEIDQREVKRTMVHRRTKDQTT